MQYETYDPGNELSGWVKCYWTLDNEAEPSPAVQTIVSDGCMEMIFHYGDLYKQYAENGDSFIQPRCFVFGQLTRPLHIQPTGSSGIFSVRFHSNGFKPFASIPIRHMDNRAVSLQELYGTEGVELEAAVLACSKAEERIAVVEEFFLQKLTDTDTIDRMVKDTVEIILSANGQLSIETVCDTLQINRRQLERKFASVVGLSPKQLSKTVRLQSTLSLLLSGQFSSLTALAYEAEYYDQAHFIKDFKEFTGYTPGEFYGEQFAMTSLFAGKE